MKPVTVSGNGTPGTGTTTTKKRGRRKIVKSQ
jgi:hypothetical protein